ncbi:MAG TPA: Flp family type IVb pilin [Parvibaculum sp.]|jgi:pilus assembly protein Flp/PilA
MAGKIFETLKSFSRDERGATAIEYGLILAGISVVVATAVETIGISMNGMFQKIVDIFAA